MYQTFLLKILIVSAQYSILEVQLFFLDSLQLVRATQFDHIANRLL